MHRLAGIALAPKRGRYDRALSRHDRQVAQRERLIAAIAIIATTGADLNIAAVVAHAGIGRNTFYEYFDDIEHALRTINERARRELSTHVEAALHVARTPLEWVRAFARAWAQSLAASPTLAKLALRAQTPAIDAAELSRFGRYAATVLEREIDSRAALPGLADQLRTTAVAAMFDAVSRAHLAKGQVSVDELQRVLAELALRLLR